LGIGRGYNDFVWFNTNCISTQIKWPECGHHHWWLPKNSEKDSWFPQGWKFRYSVCSSLPDTSLDTRLSCGPQVASVMCAVTFLPKCLASTSPSLHLVNSSAKSPSTIVCLWRHPSFCKLTLRLTNAWLYLAKSSGYGPMWVLISFSFPFWRTSYSFSSAKLTRKTTALSQHILTPLWQSTLCSSASLLFFLFFMRFIQR
jgi:hypothetical protein